MGAAKRIGSLPEFQGGRFLKGMALKYPKILFCPLNGAQKALNNQRT